MLHGLLATIVRYFLTIGGSMLVATGLLTHDELGFCVNLHTASDILAGNTFTWVSGITALVVSFGWRFLAKKREGK